MNKNLFSENEIEKMLNSLDGIERAAPEPFFYTRLRARMEKESSRSGFAFFSWLRPSTVIAIFSIFLVLNVVTLSMKGSDSKTKVQQSPLGLTDQFASDYDLNISSY